jgi:hypothetical protein
MLVHVDAFDSKEREFSIVSVKPVSDGAAASGAAQPNHLQ